MNKQHLDPKSVWLFFMGYLSGIWIMLAFLIAPIMIGLSNSFTFGFSLPGWILLLLAASLGFCWFWAKLSYSLYLYELKDNGFSKESGVIWKKYVTIPYSRIQNIDIHRGVLARMLGLSDLHIQTAGASGQIASEGRLPGISREVAEQLRDELVRRASASNNQGL